MSPTPKSTRQASPIKNQSDSISPRLDNPCLEKQPVSTSPPDSPQHAGDMTTLPLSRALLVGFGIWFTIFLYSLDQTIVANAIPSITKDFKSSLDVGWYGSAYLLTTAGFQLFYGQLYSTFSVKYTYFAAICTFELGSLICALAPTSTALITGRAVAGVGSAGLASGSMIIISRTFRPRIRPMAIASIGIVFAIAAVLGPVLGGVFTTQLTWRWCFWINLPFGSAAMIMIYMILPNLEAESISQLDLRERLKKIDFIGLFVFLAAISCILLVLQRGGSVYSWRDGRIIALLILFTVLMLAFIGLEYWKGEDASLPIWILTNKIVAAAVFNGFCNFATFITLVYYLPFWQQIVRGVDAESAGIRVLPFILGVVLAANLSGAVVSKYGCYASMMVLSSLITPIGVGLLTTWTTETTFSRWVGYQTMAGIGLGLGQQQPLIAINSILTAAHIPAGTSLIMLVQTMSGAIFVSIGQSVLQNQLQKRIQDLVPGIEIESIISTDASHLLSMIPQQYIPELLTAYNDALTNVFIVALCTSACAVFGSIFIMSISTSKRAF